MNKNNNYDITKNIDVTKEELKKGTSREISLKTGESLNVDIPKNTPNGRVLKIKGLGKKNPSTNKRGDLNLVINIIDDEVEKEKVPENNKKEVKSEKKTKSKKVVRNNDTEYFDPEIINYDSVVFINHLDAKNGCLKKATIPPKIKALIQIPAGVSNEEIITTNVNGVQRKVLVIICDIDYEKMENMNKALGIDASIKVEESYYEYTNKEITVEGVKIKAKIPRFSGRKCLIYLRGEDATKPGCKIIVTKEDGRFKFNKFFETWGTIAIMVWFLGFAIDYEKELGIPTIAFYAGELIGAVIIFEFIRWLIGNNKWN